MTWSNITLCYLTIEFNIFISKSSPECLNLSFELKKKLLYSAQSFSYISIWFIYLLFYVYLIIKINNTN